MNVLTLDTPKMLFKTHPHASINKTTEVFDYIEERQKTSNLINFFIFSNRITYRKSPESQQRH